MTAPYFEKYPGYWAMKWHDDEKDLKRWFENWKVEKYASFAAQYEWLTITETKVKTLKGRTVIRYVGTIGRDDRRETRSVVFELGAPSPPTFFRPITETPDQRDRRINQASRANADRMWEAEQRWMRDRLYMSHRLYHYSPLSMILPADSLPPSKPAPPPPPQYRRN